MGYIHLGFHPPKCGGRGGISDEQCAIWIVDDGALRRVVEPGIHGPFLQLARALIDHASVPWVAMYGLENRNGKAAQSTRSDGAVSERGKRSHLKLLFGIGWVLMYTTFWFLDDLKDHKYDLLGQSQINTNVGLSW